MQPSEYITVMLVPSVGEIEVDLEKLNHMGIHRVVFFLHFREKFPFLPFLVHVFQSAQCIQDDLERRNSQFLYAKLIKMLKLKYSQKLCFLL